MGRPDARSDRAVARSACRSPTSGWTKEHSGDSSYDSAAADATIPRRSANKATLQLTGALLELDSIQLFLQLAPTRGRVGLGSDLAVEQVGQLALNLVSTGYQGLALLGCHAGIVFAGIIEVQPMCP
jgi:hypothetical protein